MYGKEMNTRKISIRIPSFFIPELARSFQLYPDSSRINPLTSLILEILEYIHIKFYQFCCPFKAGKTDLAKGSNAGIGHFFFVYFFCNNKYSYMSYIFL